MFLPHAANGLSGSSPSADRIENDLEIFHEPPVAWHEHVDGQTQRKLCLIAILTIVKDRPCRRKPETFVLLVVFRAAAAVRKLVLSAAQEKPRVLRRRVVTGSWPIDGAADLLDHPLDLPIPSTVSACQGRRGFETRRNRVYGQVHGFGGTSRDPCREGSAGVLPHLFCWVLIFRRTGTQALCCLTRTDRFDDVGDPSFGLVMAQFETGNQFSNLRYVCINSSKSVLHRVDGQDLRIGVPARNYATTIGKKLPFAVAS